MVIATQKEWRAKWNDLWSRENLCSVSIAVAYCSRNGVSQIKTAWNKRQPRVSLLVGLNDGVTDIFAREALCNWQNLSRGKVEVKGEFQSSGRFHPKVYIFDCGEETHILIGSVNLTKSAFYENTEASIELVGPSESKKIREFVDAIELWWADAPLLSLEAVDTLPLSVEARLLETMRNGALVDIEATLSPARGHFKDDIFELGAELYQEEGAFSVERLRKTEVMLLGQKTHKELEKRRDQAHENCRNLSFTTNRGHFVPVTAFTQWKTRQIASFANFLNHLATPRSCPKKHGSLPLSCPSK